MQILLISVYESVVAYGLRCISAVLKREGFPVKLLFLPRETEGFRYDGFKYFYDPEVLAQITDLARGVDLVGISFAIIML